VAFMCVQTEKYVAYVVDHRKWIILPRKVSVDIPYNEDTDEVLGSNLMLIADEDFTRIEGMPYF